ncbi:unnamed protein product [Schistosoma turkestanicum]|nr:unnamed protein product [Schistosoma turkestanicum]
MHFSKYHLDTPLYLQKCRVPTIISARDLGISYSRSLKFEEHDSNIISESRRLIRSINKNFLTSEAKLTRFKICIRPSLQHCSLIFSNMNIMDKMRVENVQRSFTRRLLALSHNLDYTERCKHPSLEPLWRRRFKKQPNAPL